MSANSKAGAPTRKTVPVPPRTKIPSKPVEAPPVEPVVPAVEHDHDHDHAGHDHAGHDHEHVRKPAPPNLAEFHAALPDAGGVSDELREALGHMARTLEDEATRGKPRPVVVKDLASRLNSMVNQHVTGGAKSKLTEALSAFTAKLLAE